MLDTYAIAAASFAACSLSTSGDSLTVAGGFNRGLLEAYDAGYEWIWLLDDDTLESLGARVFSQECVAYPEAIRLFAEGRLKIEGRRVRVHPNPSPRTSKNEE